MKFGIDLGTTRTIVALVDRGNYPVVSFSDPDGDTADHFPSAVARRGDRLVFGFEAERAAAEAEVMVADGPPLQVERARMVFVAGRAVQLRQADEVPAQLVGLAGRDLRGIRAGERLPRPLLQVIQMLTLYS